MIRVIIGIFLLYITYDSWPEVEWVISALYLSLGGYFLFQGVLILLSKDQIQEYQDMEDEELRVEVEEEKRKILVREIAQKEISEEQKNT